MARSHDKMKNALKRIDSIAGAVAALAEGGSSILDSGVLLSLQEQIDAVLSTLFGKNFQLDAHVVRVWSTDTLDSRMPVGRLTADAMSEDLLRAAARLRQIQLDFESLPASAQKDSLIKNENLGADSGPVFLIHGHDHVRRDLVKGFLAELGVQVVVSLDTPANGMTIAEKIDEAGGASFAVAVLTPDDVGRAVVDQPGHEAMRARQNVIYELGYFAGRLGRHRVCVLRSSALELPSDLNGQVFIDLDEPEWKTRLVREMRAAGIPINLTGWI